MKRSPLGSTIALAALAFVASCSSTAQAPQSILDAPEVSKGTTAHTMSSESAPKPSGTVDDLDFMVGRWTGQAFGGDVEECWNPVMGGQMLGTFRLVNEDGPVFSEHMLLTEVEGAVVLRLKHFNPDLTGWEEKDGFVDFELLSVEDQTAWFDGLTIIRRGAQLTLHLAMQSQEGAREETFRLQRDERSD